MTDLECARAMVLVLALPQKHGSIYTTADRVMHCRWEMFWGLRVAELEAESRVEKKREQPHLTNREAFARLDERLDQLEAAEKESDDTHGYRLSYIQSLEAVSERADERTKKLAERVTTLEVQITEARNRIARMSSHYRKWK